MYNLVYLIWRLVSDPELKKSENSKDYTSITLAVQRSFKNVDGIYETDFVNCILWNGIAQNTTEFCKKGDLVGIRGRIQVRSYQEGDETKYVTEIVVERISFLASKKVEINE